jgi:DNA-binding MarR family transcriptional regulator
MPAPTTIPNQEIEYHDQQYALLAVEAVRLMSYVWFGTRAAAADRYMSALLMNVYAFSMIGKPLSKKGAWRQMGVQDIKTGRKYISGALKMGLIESVQSTEDQRMDLLYPTDRLRKLAEWRLRDFALHLRSLMYALLDYPLPGHGGPKILREEMSPNNLTGQWEGGSYSAMLLQSAREHLGERDTVTEVNFVNSEGSTQPDKSLRDSAEQKTTRKKKRNPQRR